MKALLIGEYREGRLLDTTYELCGFAQALGAETAMLLVGNATRLPAYGGTLYLADAAACGEYHPDLHKQLILDAIQKENPDYVVFMHSSYGWDLAPRVAARLKAAQISEIIAIVNGQFEVGCCNAKMRRTIKPSTPRAVLTIQAGAFPAVQPGGAPQVQQVSATADSRVSFVGYEPAEAKDVDLARAEVIVTAGRGIGKKDNVPVIQALAKALGGELGASRPVVDAGWVDHSHQVGTTGQTVSPKLYIACGVSGAIQHLAGMKKSDFIVAINKDKDAPIGEIADVLVVADVMQFIPALTAKVAG
ncbi:MULTISPECIES: electron transfer flavoprotein subunit alpha/FixB family protein [Geobacter]|uniref:Electron transfer flavoprotein subunit alpha n=2 Tax=Geobacter TaxID=28231 RepID=A0A0C1U612_9BACT|nr:MULTISPECIES: electron transfer flavoprotein subunit alpha/FixB family protein [Geobacter]KIE43150.1 electron transfer flavoprotein subunit alpha [Geobacter soli]MBE2888168.1 electron transfer flavoprotein subunit alpha/FixB family protein [Geobacter anodireducens]HMN03303.1 electron transfer flavoprotein subunit alpha/FixB family protein [Geobacter anodireducens]